MSQTLKPDRPIWPPVPETPSRPDAGETGSATSDPAAPDTRTEPAERPAAGSNRSSGFEGFGSFAG